MVYMIGSMLLFSIGLYEIITAIVPVPSRRTDKLLGQMAGQRGIAADIQNRILEPAITKTARLIRLDEYRREKLEHDLKRIGDRHTPEEFYAQALLASAGIALGGLLFIPLGIPIVSVGLVLMAVLIFFQQLQGVREKLNKINDEILKELPKFVRTYSNSYGKDVQITDIMEKYRLIAGEAFRYDLDILIADLKTGNEEEALARFADRINLPDLSTFISGVIGTAQGIDQRTFFFFMEQNMKVLARENLKKEIQKRPAKIKKATVIMAMLLFVIFLYPIVIDLKNGLGIFH